MIRDNNVQHTSRGTKAFIDSEHALRGAIASSCVSYHACNVDL